MSFSDSAVVRPGPEELAVALTQALLAGAAARSEVLDSALLAGMEAVGRWMRDGEASVLEVLPGGTSVTAAWAEEIGAGGYGTDAGMAVERAGELVG